MTALQTGAATPPKGVTPDFDHPTDVLRTVNYVTQALSLVFVTLFMFLKYYAKTTVLRGTWNLDDCTDAIPPRGIDISGLYLTILKDS